MAMKIKDTFLAEKGLAGKVKKLPYDKVFKLDNVKMVSGPCVYGGELITHKSHTLMLQAEYSLNTAFAQVAPAHIKAYRNHIT